MSYKVSMVAHKLPKPFLSNYFFWVKNLAVNFFWLMSQLEFWGEMS